MNTKNINKGIIFDIQKFSLHDGPGIRTTVFLKGCNMRCAWCHNPESFRIAQELSYDKNKCTNCGECAKACSSNVHEFIGGKHIIHFDNCSGCGKCVEVCTENALKIIGREAVVEDILAEVEKDRKYYKESGGGITLSGGEISFQYEFALELLKESKKRGIHTCIETNGTMHEKKLIGFTEYVDLFLLDYKLTDPELHSRFTGVSNEQILKNLGVLAENNCPVILRCPIIPGINDTEKHFKGIADISNNYNCITGVEIMSYHNIGRDKWSSIGLDYSLYDLCTVPKEMVVKWKDKLIAYGVSAALLL